MTGLYYLPLPTLCHEAGFTEAEARATLAVLIDLDFVRYDFATESVWVIEAARYQVADTLSGGDKRIPAVVRELHLAAARCGSLHAAAFYRKYRKRYSLPLMSFRRVLRSHEKEQEKEQEQENGHPPIPPAEQGGTNGSGGSRSKGQHDHLAEALQFAIAKGERPGRQQRRTIRDWLRAGHTLAEVCTFIERGDHVRPPPL